MILRGMDETLKKIKKVILETARKYGIEVDRIILFGSRARGDYREDSDWDILVVTRGRLVGETRDMFVLEIVRKLAKEGLDVHPIVVSREGFEARRKYVGTVEGFATIEGKVL